ncbi:MAG TPA: hypothetical protein VM510_10210, partial [Caulifigura sp.]|nr:hypothetical protein [Caulifigura sp.]
MQRRFNARALCGTIIVSLFGGVLGQGVSAADRWTSDDGVIAVTLPNLQTFLPIQNPPAPVIRGWELDAGGLRLAVVRSDFPPDVRMSPKSLQEGFIEEIGGTITKSSERESNGHAVHVMSAATMQQGQPVVVSQAVIQHGNHAYKAMALAAANDPELVAAANQFIASLEVIADPVTPPPKAADDGVDLHEVSKRVGSWGVITLIVIDVLTRRRKRHSVAGDAPGNA